jgi:cellulose synthase/poly-beta-1,6-N-acetylglucosamine synthase-like glycosyltransferase
MDILRENAKITLNVSQKIWILLFLLLCGVLFYLFPCHFVFFLNLFVAFLYLVVIVYKAILVVAGAFGKRELSPLFTEYAYISEERLPIYTVLLPVYKETEVISQLIEAIRKLEYPFSKLDVKLLVEENDHKMRHFLAETTLPSFFELIIIPDGKPKTKARACNVGLARARGEFTVIYDAEDIPEPDQLRKSVAAFRAIGDESVVCLQAKLNYYNQTQNILTRWFTVEYSQWFDLYLPGLDRFQVPIPLGGTSNHFRTHILKELGGWDAWNVTEDCDLGMRISSQGYRTRILDSTTWEEANSLLGNWLRQRSRWVKGYIQTYCVFLRHPFLLAKKLGLRNLISFHLTIGGQFFTLLLNPFYWFATIGWLWFRFLSMGWKGYWVGIDLLTWILFTGNLFFVAIGIAGCLKRRFFHLLPAACISPFYWILMSMGAWKGFCQLFHKPHYWEKTQHGLTGPQPPS